MDVCFGGVESDFCRAYLALVVLDTTEHSGLPMEKSYGTINEAVVYSGMSRTGIYNALASGKLTAKKAGRRTLISFADIDAYFRTLPAFKAEAAQI